MTFISALLLGLLASAHCAGMCGGLQSVLQQTTTLRSARDNSWHLIALNSGRLITYISAGTLIAAAGSQLVVLLDVPLLTRAARTMTAIILIVIGGQMLLSKLKPFAWLEFVGAGLWRVVSRLIPDNGGDRLSRSLIKGVIWGFLPCGLIYGVLLSTLFADNAIAGGVIMLGFGLGTLPAMILTGESYMALRGMIKARASQWIGGAIFVQGGVLMLIMPSLVSTDFTATYPQLMSHLFCVR